MKYKVLSIKKELLRIQNDLLQIGYILSNPKYSLLNTKYFLERIRDFENVIDDLTQKLPKLKNFILPGGGATGAFLHLARAVCRRLERRIVELNSKKKIDSNILVYFNRLSDLLFTMARFANFKEKRKERIWYKNG